MTSRPIGAGPPTGTQDEPIYLDSESDDDAHADSEGGGAGGAGTTVSAWSARAEQERLGEQAARRLQQTYDEEEQRHRKKVRSWQVHWCGGGGCRIAIAYSCLHCCLRWKLVGIECERALGNVIYYGGKGCCSC